MVDLKDEQDEIDALLKEMEGDDVDTSPGDDPDRSAQEDPEGEITAGPEAQVAPEAVEGGEPAPSVDTDESGNQRMVAHQAFHAERAKRQEVERELEQYRQERARDQERITQTQGELRAIKEMFQAEQGRRDEARKAQEAEAAKPKLREHVRVPQEDDPDFSLKAYHEAMNQNAEADRHNMRIELEAAAEARAAAMLEEKMRPISEAYQTHQQSAEQQTRLGQLYSAVEQREAVYAQGNPDYYEAVQAYKAAKVKDYQTAMGMDQATAFRQVQSDMVNEAHNLLTNGRDPAQVWHALARQRGWSGQGQQAAAPQQQAAQPQQQRPAGQTSASTMARGMASSDGLAQAASSGGGGSQNAEVTLETILDTKDDTWLNANMDKVERLLAQIEGR